MKKILLFIDCLGAGGAQRQLAGLAVMLQNVGYDITVVTYHDLDFYKFELDANKVRNVLIPNADSPLKRIPAVFKFFSKEKPDLIISYLETPSLISCLCKLFGGKFKLIVSERNTTQYIGWREKIRFLLFSKADAIVPNSYSQEKFLRSNYSKFQNKITTISNFVDFNNFVPCIKEKSNVPLITVIATVWASKNALGFIEAVRILKSRNLDFNVKWYGVVEGHEVYVAQCLTKIKNYGLENIIQFFPKTNQIYDIYKSCDFFCLPSFYEGTPNVICEAMACGCPIICSSVCDNSIYVVDGNNGFLFDPTKPESIADAIERAFELSDDEYRHLCVNSRQKAEKSFSKKIFIDKYIKIIESL